MNGMGDEVGIFIVSGGCRRCLRRGEPVLAATSMSRKYELQMILHIIKTHSVRLEE